MSNDYDGDPAERLYEVCQRLLHCVDEGTCIIMYNILLTELIVENCALLCKTVTRPYKTI